MYPAFTVLVAAHLARELILWDKFPYSLGYAKLWSISSIGTWIGEIAASAEVCEKVFSHYPGIGRFARTVLRGCFGVAVVLACALLGGDWIRTGYGAEWFRSVVLIGRGVGWLCAGTLVAQAVFFQVFPRPITVNLRYHRMLLMCWFALCALASVLAASMTPTLAIWTNILYNSGLCVLWASWIFCLRPDHEYIPWTPLRMTPEEQAVLKADYELAITTLKSAQKLTLDAMKGRR